MPMSGAERTISFTRSAPLRWPTRRGQPFWVAQRPLPSMMIATCVAWRGACGIARGSGLDLHDLVLLGVQRLVDQLDVSVGHLLHLLLPELGVVLGQVVGPGLLDPVHAVAAQVADGDAGMFGILRRDLG